MALGFVTRSRQRGRAAAGSRRPGDRTPGVQGGVCAGAARGAPCVATIGGTAARSPPPARRGAGSTSPWRRRSSSRCARSESRPRSFVRVLSVRVLSPTVAVRVVGALGLKWLAADAAGDFAEREDGGGDADLAAALAHARRRAGLARGLAAAALAAAVDRDGLVELRARVGVELRGFVGQR